MSIIINLDVLVSKKSSLDDKALNGLQLSRAFLILLNDWGGFLFQRCNCLGALKLHLLVRMWSVLKVLSTSFLSSQRNFEEKLFFWVQMNSQFPPSKFSNGVLGKCSRTVRTVCSVYWKCQGLDWSNKSGIRKASQRNGSLFGSSF